VSKRALAVNRRCHVNSR